MRKVSHIIRSSSKLKKHFHDAKLLLFKSDPSDILCFVFLNQYVTEINERLGTSFFINH